MPGQEGLRGDDTGDFGQEFPTERLTLYREPPPLVIREAKLPPAKPSFEDFVLLEQVDDSGLLLTLDPTSDGDDEQCPGQLTALVPEADHFVRDAFEKGESPRGLVQKLLMLLDDYGHDELRRRPEWLSSSPGRRASLALARYSATPHRRRLCD